MKTRIWINFFLILALFLPFVGVSAQDADTGGPVYIVQPGDSLWVIAQKFGVSLEALVSRNGISDPSQLSIGARLVIPGLDGLSGVLVTESVSFGENLTSLSQQYNISVDLLARLNHFTSPLEAYAGSNLIVPASEDNLPKLTSGRVMQPVGLSFLEIAIKNRTSPWAILNLNQMMGSWAAIPGMILQLPVDGASGPGGFPNLINAIVLNQPVIQGQTLYLSVQSEVDLSLQGSILEQDLVFFPDSNQQWIALAGIHAMSEPGLYPLEVYGILPDGTSFGFSQLVYVWDGGYPYDPVLVVDSETIDQANTQPEDEQWRSMTSAITQERYWEGEFLVPVPEYLSECYPSQFGHRRSYNGSAYAYFHTGLDFCGQTGVDIYAAAPGSVVFAGPLTVRGNATIIDHGWGVYTAYAHQSQILVNPGDWVDAGQLIGKVGSTGRVTGPHLHWEVIVQGVQVNPLQWIEQKIP